MNPAALSEEKIVEIGRECRRYFHAHPEISTQEAETSAKIFSLLEEWGLSPEGERATMEWRRPSKESQRAR